MLVFTRPAWVLLRPYRGVNATREGCFGLRPATSWGLVRQIRGSPPPAERGGVSRPAERRRAFPPGGRLGSAGTSGRRWLRSSPFRSPFCFWLRAVVVGLRSSSFGRSGSGALSGGRCALGTLPSSSAAVAWAVRGVARRRRRCLVVGAWSSVRRCSGAGALLACGGAHPFPCAPCASSVAPPLSPSSSVLAPRASRRPASLRKPAPRGGGAALRAAPGSGPPGRFWLSRLPAAALSPWPGSCPGRGSFPAAVRREEKKRILMKRKLRSLIPHPGGGPPPFRRGGGRGAENAPPPPLPVSPGCAYPA